MNQYFVFLVAFSIGWMFTDAVKLGYYRYKTEPKYIGVYIANLFQTSVSVMVVLSSI